MRLGKVTENVLKRSVLKPLTKQAYKGSAAVGTDCAFSIKEDGKALCTLRRKWLRVPWTMTAVARRNRWRPRVR